MDEKRTGYISIGEMAKMNRTTVPTLRLRFNESAYAMLCG